MPATQEAGIFDESALVAKAREGDLTAFNELVKPIRERSSASRNILLRMMRTPKTSCKRLSSRRLSTSVDFQGQSKFYTWIVRIAVNESLMKLRKRKSDRSVPLDEPVDTGEDTVVREIAVWEENPEQKYSREELGQILDEAVESLRPAFRTVFVLRDIEELSTEETAEALGISVPAVKSRLLRARLQLREKLTRFFKRKGDDVFAYM